MTFSTEDAVSDEPVAGAFPTDAELGRQIKRLKTSTTLNMFTETCPTVTDGVIGARFAKATCMAVDMAVSNAGGAPGNLDLINAIGMAINRACAPQGPISTAISGAIETACAPQGIISTTIDRACAGAIETACAPQGIISTAIDRQCGTAIDRACAPQGIISTTIDRACAGAIEIACAPQGIISTAIDRACAPQGIISTAIDRACAPQGIISTAISGTIDRACAPPCAVHTVVNTVMRAIEQRSLARLHNGNVRAGAMQLQPLLGTDDTFPGDFPRTYGEFARMTVVQIDVLLGSYGLADGGSETEKLERLTAFCNVNLPK